MKPTQTVSELRKELATRLGVDAKTLKIFTDQTMKRALAGRDTDTLTKAGLKNGDMLHINNKDAQITQIVQAKQFKTQEEVKNTEEENAKKEEDAGFASYKVDSSGKQIKILEKKEETVAKDSKGQVIKAAEKIEAKKEVNMINKKVLGDDVDKDGQFVKHISFENHLIEMKKRCKDKHLPSQKC